MFVYVLYHVPVVVVLVPNVYDFVCIDVICQYLYLVLAIIVHAFLDDLNQILLGWIAQPIKSYSVI